MKIIKKIFIILITLGLLISIYLTYSHYSNTAVFCSLGNEVGNNGIGNIYSLSNNTKQLSSCDKVLQSDYSSIFGIPMAVLGIVFYLGIFGTYILFLLNKIKYIREILLTFTFIGVLFSIYFSYLQYFVINGFCYYCLTSAFITYLLFGISLYFKFKKDGKK